jgi:hypothetical protein
MKLPAILALLGAFVGAPQLVAALGPNDAETMYEAFNNALLTTSGNSAFYKAALNTGSADGTW